MYEIKSATAIYTGGGIYIYYGQLDNGNWFRACDDWEWIAICDSDTSTDEADYPEFYEEHEIGSLTDDEYVEFWNKMILFILTNKSIGNYSPGELEDRLLTENLEFCWDEQVDRLQAYIEENFTLGGTSKRLVRNILDYAAAQDWSDPVPDLMNLLDGIGITKAEIVKAIMGG